MKIRDTDMNVVLTLGDNSVVDGYVAMDGFEEGQRGWRRLTVEAARVDGAYDVARARARQTITLPVYIEGADVADARAKHRALLDAVEVEQWVLDVAGDGTTAVFACAAADEGAPVGLFEGGRKRIVTLSIPAQPAYGF